MDRLEDIQIQISEKEKLLDDINKKIDEYSIKEHVSKDIYVIQSSIIGTFSFGGLFISSIGLLASSKYGIDLVNCFLIPLSVCVTSSVITSHAISNLYSKARIDLSVRKLRKDIKEHSVQYYEWCNRKNSLDLDIDRLNKTKNNIIEEMEEERKLIEEPNIIDVEEVSNIIDFREKARTRVRKPSKKW